VKVLLPTNGASTSKLGDLVLVAVAAAIAIALLVIACP
jgi:hypothetical protein